MITAKQDSLAPGRCRDIDVMHSAQLLNSAGIGAKGVPPVNSKAAHRGMDGESSMIYHGLVGSI